MNRIFGCVILVAFVAVIGATWPKPKDTGTACIMMQAENTTCGNITCPENETCSTNFVKKTVTFSDGSELGTCAPDVVNNTELSKFSCQRNTTVYSWGYQATCTSCTSGGTCLNGTDTMDKFGDQFQGICSVGSTFQNCTTVADCQTTNSFCVAGQNETSYCLVKSFNTWYTYRGPFGPRPRGRGRGGRGGWGGWGRWARFFWG